jgi:hypothetical protein
MERQTLATSLAEVESQVAGRQAKRGAQAGRGRQRRERSFALLLVGALTLFAVAIDGYHPCAEDGGLYMAGVKRLLDPALYPHSTAFVLEPMRHSLFAPTVAAAVRLTHLSLPVVLLAFHLASIWLTLFAAWMLAVRCWTSRPARIGAVVLLACWLALPIAGTALLFMDPYATARSLSTPAMVLALLGALDMTARGSPFPSQKRKRQRGLLLCAASLAVAAAMHPLMAAYALGATLMLLAARSPNRTLRLCATAALATSALALAACLQAVARPESAAYLRIAMTRTYWFPAQWRWYELAGLAAPLAILTIFAFRKPGAPSIAHLRSGSPASLLAGVRMGGMKGAPSIAHLRSGSPANLLAGVVRMGGMKNALSIPRSLRNGWELASQYLGRTGEEANDASRALARMAIAVGATSCLIALLFARAAAATHLIARLQPLRAFQIVYLVLALTLGATLGERILRRRAWRWAAAMLLLGGISFTAGRTAFPNSNHLELPGTAPRNPWAQAFLWARDHTPKDALFALDADYINAPGEDAQCFRAIAQRSALPDYSKDGGEASIAPGLTADWVRGQAAQQSLSAPSTTDERRVAALQPLGVTWLVLQEGATTRLNCPYANSAVKLCHLP